MKIKTHQWKFLKERASNIDYEKDIDPAMQSLVSEINSYNCFATVWCCSGHENDSGTPFSLPYLVIVEDPNNPLNNPINEVIERLDKVWQDRDGLALEVSSTALLADPEWEIGTSYRAIAVRLINRTTTDMHKQKWVGNYSVQDKATWETAQKFMIVMGRVMK